MNYVELILKGLEPKAKQFGFTKEELKSAAAILASNLGLAEDASEEDVNKRITEVIDTVGIPMLKMSQSASGRAIEAYKQAHPETKPAEERTPSPKTGTEEVPEWAKNLQEQVKSLMEENKSLKNTQVSTSRRERLEVLFKDSGKYGESQLKAFDRMTFKDDADFDDYFAAAESGLKDYKKELSEHGLENLGNPPAPSSKTEQEKGLTESEIDSIAELYH